VQTLLSILSAMLSQTAVYLGAVLALCVLVWVSNKWTGVVVHIKNDEYGVVEKIWSFGGSVRSGFMLDNRAAVHREEH
jgi:uncharacterized membrane protein YqiK